MKSRDIASAHFRRTPTTKPPEPLPTVVLDTEQHVRVIAPGIDVSAKLSPQKVAELVVFTLKLISS